MHRLPTNPILKRKRWSFLCSTFLGGSFLRLHRLFRLRLSLSLCLCLCLCGSRSLWWLLPPTLIFLLIFLRVPGANRSHIIVYIYTEGVCTLRICYTRPILMAFFDFFDIYSIYTHLYCETTAYITKRFPIKSSQPFSVFWGQDASSSSPRHMQHCTCGKSGWMGNGYTKEFAKDTPEPMHV